MKKEDIYNAPKYAGIYMFRNLLNGKCYIGQAIKLRRRLQHHLNNLEHNRYDAPIYRAFKKYGIENFELKILQTWHDALGYKTKKYLDMYEKQYIQEYNSYVPNGYNLTLGGDGGTEGYKFTEEQKDRTSENSRKTQNDGRNLIYCYNIITGKTITASSVTTLSEMLNEKILHSSVRNKICKGKYLLARTKEEFQNKIVSFKKGQLTKNKCFSAKLKDEMIADIKNGMTQTEFINKYKVCKKTYINYKKAVIPDYVRVYTTKVDLNEFKQYLENHTIKECSIHFNIPEKRAYIYKKKIFN